MLNPKVSIIVPVFNTEEFLPQCLDSILNQTMLGIEVICVDDGSTDSSLSILYSYAAKDGRVRVIQQDNLSGGAARNRGMEIARGEYLLFLDSDDFFSEKLAETAYNLAKEHDADVAIFGADTFDNVEQKHISTPWYVNEPLLPVQQPFCAADIPQDIFNITTPVPWNKLFKRSFLMEQKLQFQPIANANDLFCSLSSLLLADKIVYTNEVLVSYRRGMSNNTQSRREQAPRCFYEALSALKDMMVERGIYSNYEKPFKDFARSVVNFNFKAISFEALPLEERMEMERSFGLPSCYATDFDNERDIKITVAVAVYNTAEYLPTCIESIIQQTYPNLEIICVNDGSTDNSLEILQEYAAKDDRIIIIDKVENEKLMLGRKSAVDAATGDYLVFVDSDDYLAPNAMETLAHAIIAYDVDVIHFTTGLELAKPDVEYEKYFKTHHMPMAATLNNAEYMQHTFLTRKVSTNLWGRAYKLEVLRKAYAEVPIQPVFVGEDIFAMYYIAYFTRSYKGLLTAPLYFYRFGLGVTNKEAMPLEKFSMYSGMGNLVQWTNDFLHDKKYTKIQVDALTAMSKRMLEDVVRIFETERIDPEDIHAAELMVAEDWHKISGAGEMIERKLGKTLSELTNELLDVPEYAKLARNHAMSEVEPLVSVIIPAFNTEEFLNECIDSVLEQSKGNVEIILVNDGSHDNSLEIMETYYEQHDCITVISQKNAGLSAARNAGMRLARGKYILFVDSDDMIGNDCINVLTAIADERELDFITFDADGFIDATGELSPAEMNMKDMYHRSDYGDEVYTGVELLCQFTKNREYRTPAWLMLLRRSWLMEEKIWFEDGILHEDNPFTFACYLHANRCSHIALDGYLRRLRDGSIMTSEKNINHLRGYFASYLLMAAEARRVGIAEEDHFEVQYRIRTMFDSAKAIYQQLVNEKRFVARTSFDSVMQRMMENALPQCGKESIWSLRQQLAKYADSSTLASEVQRLEKIKAEQQAKINAMKKDQGERFEQLIKLQHEKAERYKELQTLKKEKGERWEEMQKLRRQIKEMQKEKGERYQELLALKKEKGERWNQLQEALKGSAAAKNQAAALQRENDRLKAQQEKDRQQIQQLRDEKAERYQQIQALNAEKAERYQQIQQLSAEKAERYQQAQALQKEKSERWQEMQKLQQQINALEKERKDYMADAKKQVAALQRENERLKVQQGNDRQQIKALNAEKTERYQQVLALQKEKSERWQEMQKLRKENTELLQATRVQRKVKQLLKINKK